MSSATVANQPKHETIRAKFEHFQKDADKNCHKMKRGTMKLLSLLKKSSIDSKRSGNLTSEK
ncbi:hypothetical protein Cantr_07598 [Candida viswanathii]|uniref:Uncharacterized protein n=1 Tax=Candida viswanathii TaxID=5486 RepID=A0A367Y3F7_9ASCO|nr:hypothetical protein Cantr_07598 [Candida viswanathii]